MNFWILYKNFIKKNFYIRELNFGRQVQKSPADLVTLKIKLQRLVCLSVPSRVNYMNQTGATKQLSFRLKYTDWLQLPSQTLYRVIKSGKRSMKISLFWLFSWNKRLFLGLVKPITFRNRDEYIYCVSGNWQPWAYIFVQAKGSFWELWEELTSSSETRTR